MWWVVGIHVSLSTEMKVLNFHGLYSSMYHLLVCKFQICLTCTLSDAFSSCSPIRSTIFLSWFMYFWAVFKTQGGNVALNRSVWGLSSLAEKQMVINIKNNQFYSRLTWYILQWHWFVLQLLLKLFRTVNIKSYF